MNLKSLFWHISCAMSLLCVSTITSQNLLDPYAWTTGSGNTLGYTAYGNAANNIRENGLNHVGESHVLWKASHDASGNPDGGWNTYQFVLGYPFYHRTVRFSVWIKKTNSHSGSTYFGFNAYGSGYYDCLPLDGNFSDNSHPSDPYFFVGDLPQLDRWYLLVGYVHESNYSGPNLGRIYDGVTGEEVQEIRDYKFYTTVVQVRHRAYLANSTNANDEQYFYGPRMEYADGNEWTLDQLLSVNTDSQLLFAYDNAGNQKQRFYCSQPGCVVPNPPAGRFPIEEEVSNEEGILDDDLLDPTETHTLSITPNPTNGKFSVRVSGVDYSLKDAIHIYNSNGVLMQSIKIAQPKTSQDLDISNLPSGVYLVHFHLSNGETVDQKIIKK